MTLDDKITMVQALSDETDEEVISAFLSMAGSALCRYADPYHTMTEEALLELYPDVQVDIAAYKLGKRGWDYENRHVENGVTREYEVGDVPPSILARVTRIASGVK